MRTDRHEATKYSPIRLGGAGRTNQAADESPRKGGGPTLTQRWAVRFAVQGDLRFLSHHDSLRAVERTIARAALPLRYSQGFNPHPVLSLACPRPVGVAGRDELLAVSLEGETAAEELVSRLNACAPEGMRFAEARLLTRRRTPRPVRVTYRLALSPQAAGDAARRLDALRTRAGWPVERKVSGKGRRDGWKVRTIDLRPLVAKLELEGDCLVMELVAGGDLWARPGEVLSLAGLDERIDLASTVRTAVEYDFGAEACTPGQDADIEGE